MQLHHNFINIYPSALSNYEYFQKISPETGKKMENCSKKGLTNFSGGVIIKLSDAVRIEQIKKEDTLL